MQSFHPILDEPPRSNQILGLDFASPHLPILRALLDVLDELLLLILKLDSFAVELALGFFEGALVFPKAFLWGHPFAKGPFDDLVVGFSGARRRTGKEGMLTFMAAEEV